MCHLLPSILSRWSITSSIISRILIDEFSLQKVSLIHEFTKRNVPDSHNSLEIYYFEKVDFKGKLFSTILNTSFVFTCSGSTNASYLIEVFITTAPGHLSCLKKSKWKPGCVHTRLPACRNLQVTALSSHTSFCPLVAFCVPTWNRSEEPIFVEV